MCAQLSLGGFDLPGAEFPPLSLHRPGKERLFLALQPGPAQWLEIRTVEQQHRQLHGLQGRALRDEHLHITLQHLLDHDQLPQDWVDRIHVAVERTARVPLDLVFDRVMSFARAHDNRPFVLLAQRDSQSLLHFQRELGLSMKSVGFLQTDRSFTPHVTLLYDRQMVPELPVPPVCWRANEMVLIHSLLGRTEHRVLARWPLH